MPVDVFSRDRFCDALQDDEGRLFLTEREPYTYRELPDTRVHVVGEGDTLTSLAARYFSGLPNASLLWWVIADFQPGGGIFDPTIRLAVGSRLYIPSVRTVEEDIFNEKRRKETQA